MTNEKGRSIAIIFRRYGFIYRINFKLKKKIQFVKEWLGIILDLIPYRMKRIDLLKIELKEFPTNQYLGISIKF